MNYQQAFPIVIGLGEFGQHLAMRLTVGGTLYVHDANPDKIESSVQVTRAIGLTSLRHLPQSCEAVILCPGSSPTEVGCQDNLLEWLTPGTLIIDMRPLGAADCLAFYERAAIRGLEYVEAAVRGGPEAAVMGELTIAVGGTPESFARARPWLETMAALVVHSGDIGTGKRALELQDVMSAVAFATAHQVLNAATGIQSGAMIDLLVASAMTFRADLRSKPGLLAAEFDSADALGRAVQRLRTKRTRTHE